MLKNKIEFYVRMGGGFEKSYVSLHGIRGVKNYQNYPYVINEWPLRILFSNTLIFISSVNVRDNVLQPCSTTDIFALNF